jgi:hypothetical protein
MSEFQFQFSSTQSADNFNSESTVALEHLQPVTVLRTGKPGRPQKVINSVFLQQAMGKGRRISLTTMAKCLRIYRHTLRRSLNEYGVDYKFTTITNAQLDTITRLFKQSKVNSGLRYLMGFLNQNGLQIQGRRVMKSLQRVDHLGRTLRKKILITRQPYKVPRPNSLWHIDGHHKLIFWGIVIHGSIDGDSHTVRCYFIFCPSSTDL